MSSGFALRPTSTLAAEVIAIVHHVLLGGQLHRQGAVVTVLPGKQSWERAWFYGIQMAAHYVNLQNPVVVHVSSTRAWEAWTQSKHGHLL